MENQYGIYVHFPFCGKRCNYCSFFAGKFDAETQSRYILSLERELRKREAECDGKLRSIYYGGGTPSSVSADNLERVSSLLLSLPGSEYLEEFTMEVNPEDVNIANVNAWKKMGVNRVSMGVQSFVDAELVAIGRRHDSRQAKNAASLLCENFSNVSLDLIIGLPGQTMQTLEESLNCILRAGVQHISVYMLSYEPRTVTGLQLEKGIIEYDEDLVSEMYIHVCDTLDAHSFKQYEISNFALSGYEGKHNSSYWRGGRYIGLGVSAHSYDGKNVRSWNREEIRSYVNGDDIRESETLLREELLEEYIMLRLRTSEGILLEDCRKRWGERICEEIVSASHQEKKARATVHISSEAVRLTKKGVLLSDDVICRIATRVSVI